MLAEGAQDCAEIFARQVLAQIDTTYGGTEYLSARFDRQHAWPPSSEWEPTRGRLGKTRSRRSVVGTQEQRRDGFRSIGGHHCIASMRRSWTCRGHSVRSSP